MKTFDLVAGTRPTFVKAAPLLEALKHKEVRVRFVHSGQHYSDELDQHVRSDLGLPEPAVCLYGHGPSVARQTAAMMTAYEDAVRANRPDLTVVFGDTNCTLACGRVAADYGITLAHVEAGLRSFDRSMPEEVNRVLTDAMADLLFVTEPAGMFNLDQEGIRGLPYEVGNTVADALRLYGPRLETSGAAWLDANHTQPRSYLLLTLHRRAIAQDTDRLSLVLDRVAEAADRLKMPVLFFAHPRTQKLVLESGRGRSFRPLDSIVYTEFAGLLANAWAAITDSGGIQEEALLLGTPCLTVRANTERPITILRGGNQLVGAEAETLVAAAEELRDACAAEEPRPDPAKIPDLWDGHAAERIADILVGWEETCSCR